MFLPHSVASSQCGHLVNCRGFGGGQDQGS
jgi:hypothetical protein